ncbi:tripartite tricarboxylate transporter permease [Pseudomonas putida]|uniref:tripartite tricarboxylate transporter permease n=1 Tax=Pseudomonas putida TaxID=303 RepID=UPI002DBE1898|nr:tripartite tricarboxylate transporter permease [Pseudomonas putida]WRW04775.1 tripartite tricarboxylate transporter permease [Pseudomonas putida]
MIDILIDQFLVALLFGVVGAVLLSLIGLISGTDETTTLAPLTMVVVLLDAPPAAVLTFFLAGAIAKHMTHAVPTALLGIPGDTMATPLMREANYLRALGAPHLALRKMIAGGMISAFIAVPASVLFAVILAPFGDIIKPTAPWIFVFAAVAIAWFSKGRLASVVALIPFVMLILGLQSFTGSHDTKLNVSFFLGIAVGPLLVDFFMTLAPAERKLMLRESPRTTSLAPDVQEWKGFFPSPFKILDSTQLKWTSATALVSSATFVFSPVAMTVILGEVVGSRVKHIYRRLTTVLSARNGVTESTYIAEALIPLIAFGLPLSPVAAGPAAPLFNAPPRFSVSDATGQVNNLHSLLTSWEFLGYGMLSVVIAAMVAYPLTMRYSYQAALFVAKKISHEAVIATFTALILIVGIWEGGVLGVFVILTLGIFGGMLSRFLGVNVGVQFMGYYIAILTVPAFLKLIG